MTIKIPDILYSAEQISRALHDIDIVLGQLGDQKVQKHVGATVRAQLGPISEPLRVLLQDNKLSLESSDELVALRTTLQDWRDNASEVRLTLAGWPSLEIKQRIVSWFRRSIDPTLLVAFSVRTDICGGIQIRAGGREIDLSYRNALLYNRKKIAELAFHGT